MTHTFGLASLRMEQTLECDLKIKVDFVMQLEEVDFCVTGADSRMHLRSQLCITGVDFDM
jgi:hypothetical protein